MLNNRKRRPSHPGAILEDILPDANLSQVELARLINEIINERRPVTVDMAHRLAIVFKTTPEFWLNLQRDVDVWDALEANKKVYDRIKPLDKAA
jgi:addiction module HigA family antidote